MQSIVYAVDLAKTVFQVAVSRHPGKVAEDHRLSRKAFRRFFAERQPAVVVMEACGSAHYWGRKLQKRGFTVVLLPPQRVRPYVPRRSKTDRADTRGLLEAYRNEEIKPVPVKTLEQQTLTSLHRVRSLWMGQRTASINNVRGLLRELGVTIPQGAHRVVPVAMEAMADADCGIPDPVQEVLVEACEKIRELSASIRRIEAKLRRLAKELPVVQQLMTIPGIGLLSATALYAFIGDVQRFPSARHFASYLGLTPKETSTGTKRRLGRISKEGDTYLRCLMVHGGRSVVLSARRTDRPDALRAWAVDRYAMGGHSKAAVAVANKLARIVWAVWRRNGVYLPKAA